MASAESPEPTTPGVSPVELVRLVVLLVALATLALWGATAWPLPWSIVFGIGAPLIALLIWALFLSPRPVLRAHPFVRAVVELLLFATVTACWWIMDQLWIGVAFAAVAITTGLVAGRRALPADRA